MEKSEVMYDVVCYSGMVCEAALSDLPANADIDVVLDVGPLTIRAAVVEGWRSASSVWRFFRANIRSKYQCKRVVDAAINYTMGVSDEN